MPRIRKSVELRMSRIKNAGTPIRKYLFSQDNPKMPLIKQVLLWDCSLSYDLVSMEDQLIAQVRPTSTWSDIFQKIIFEFGDTYAVKISDTSIDQRLFLGMVIMGEDIP